MTNYSKYVFQELPKVSVVNPNEISDITNDKDNVIVQAVTEHLQTIVTGDGKNNSLNEHKVEEEKDVLIDIDQIKLESYNRGHNEAKDKYEAIITDINIDKNLSDLLKSRLEEIKIIDETDLGSAQICSEILSNVIQNTFLLMPVDFEKILKEKLLSNLKKFYKEGSITLFVNSEKIDFCKNLLKTDELPAKLKEKFEIIEDNSLDKSDCKIQWQNTTIKFDKEQLNSEIENITQQLKSIIK